MRRSLILTTLATVLLGVLAATALARDTVPDGPALLTLQLERTLRFGDEGQAVASLQRMLRAGGYDPGKIDGIFGPLTEAAVRRAQAALHVEVDGLAGRVTVAALQESLAAAGTAADAAPEAVPVLSTALLSEPKVPSATLVVHRAVAPATPAAANPAAQAGPQSAQTSADKPFALTFNGDPDPNLLPSLLATLKQYGMGATFFVSGQTAEHSPDLLAQIAAAGHEVAVSGFSNTDMTGMSPTEAQNQLQRAREAIAAATGQTPTHFRPPLGRVNGQVAAAAAGAGLKLALWTNVTVQDPPGAVSADLAARLTDVVYPGAVVMLHQDRESTVAALEPLLAELQARGYASTIMAGFDK